MGLIRYIISTILILTLLLIPPLADAKKHKHLPKYQGHTVTIYVYGPMFYDVNYFINIRTIQNMHKGDTLVVDIHSPGGLVDVEHEYVKAWKRAGVHVITNVAPGHIAASAAQMLSIEGDEVYYADSAIFMAHAIYVIDAFGHKIILPDDTTSNLTRCCSVVINRDDIRYVNAGGEIWHNGKWVMQRLRDNHAKQFAR